VVYPYAIVQRCERSEPGHGSNNARSLVGWNSRMMLIENTPGLDSDGFGY